jgi:hypothetical protein
MAQETVTTHSGTYPKFRNTFAVLANGRDIPETEGKVVSRLTGTIARTS